MEADTPKKRGRPPGTRNRPALVRAEDESRLTPPSSEKLADYKYSDPDTLCARLLSLCDWQMQALRNEMMRAYQKRGVSIDVGDIERLERIANTLNRAIVALERSSKLAEELAKRMSPEQLIEAAAAKIEGQDAATLRYYIRRFRAYLEKVSPTTPSQRMHLDAPRNAADAVSALED